MASISLYTWVGKDLVAELSILSMEATQRPKTSLEPDTTDTTKTFEEDPHRNRVRTQSISHRFLKSVNSIIRRAYG